MPLTMFSHEGQKSQGQGGGRRAETLLSWHILPKEPDHKRQFLWQVLGRSAVGTKPLNVKPKLSSITSSKLCLQRLFLPLENQTGAEERSWLWLSGGNMFKK